MTPYYHVTALSNFLLGYDKYSKQYHKDKIPKNTYPNQFFLLKKEEISIGIAKCKSFLPKLGVENNVLLIMETLVDPEITHPNTRNGKGQYIERTWIKINTIYYYKDGKLVELPIEEAIADAYRLFADQNQQYADMRPRSISILPIAFGCQAKCKFCFSKASISSDQDKKGLAAERIDEMLLRAKEQGAERAVITGGGEPGILPSKKLDALIANCSQYFKKTVLITNGYHLLQSKDILAKLVQMDQLGLAVLSISRHHYEGEVNTRLMALNIESERIAQVYYKNKHRFKQLQIRFICVLQKGGIDSKEKINSYLDWAAKNGVESVCFKELYVSSSTESMYYMKEANQYSYQNQVPLCEVTELAVEENWEQTGVLPWGSPIFKAEFQGKTVSIAAYTEPSLSWEMANGICRSWNLMADGNCFASLETRDSKIV